MTVKRSPVCDYDRLRAAMDRAGLDLILASSRRNVGWLTDHQTEHWTWQHAILHMMEKEYDGQDYLVFAGFPRDPAKRSYLVEFAHREEAIRRRGIFADDFYGYWRRGRVPEITGDGISLEQEWTRTSVEAAVQGIKDNGLEAGTIGVEWPRISAAVMEQLRALLPRAKFVDAFELLFDLRQVKSAEEIRRFRQAYAVASATYRRVFERAGVGVTPRELLLLEMESIYSSGCSFSFAHVFFGDGQHDIAYTPPADRAIQAGDLGLFDLGVVYEGYGTDYARMAEVAPGNQKLRQYFPAILAGRRAIEDALRPGARAGDVFLAGAKVLEEHGLTASISCLGHGIGIGCHERPFLVANSEDRIEVGQMLVIEMYAEVRGLGPVLMEDGGLMTEEGWQSFGEIPTDILRLG
ncbi:MAG TPA: M24 family metallopeptidase [Candidatus Sumerlaeota bacterium]|nr:M24 family metallopeptidase [Candidatus Sumerlaeota bacterium]